MEFKLNVYTDGWCTIVGDGEVFATGVQQPGYRWLLHSQDGSTVSVTEESLRLAFPEGRATQARLGTLFAEATEAD